MSKGVDEKKRKRENVSFRVLKRFFSGDHGFITAEINGQTRNFEIRLKSKRVTVDGIPLSKLKLLFIDQPKRVQRQLAEHLQAEVYRLLAMKDTVSYLYKLPFPSSGAGKVYLYHGGIVRVWYRDKQLLDATLEDREQLVQALHEIAMREGLTLEEEAREVKHVFETLKELTRMFLEVDIGGVQLKYADGNYMRLTYREGDACYFTIPVYCKQKLGDGELTGIRKIYFKCTDGKTEIVEFVPAATGGDFIPGFEFKSVEKLVLTLSEFDDLRQTVERINRGEEEPPSFREVWGELERWRPKIVWLPKIGELKTIAYTIAMRFYDLLPVFCMLGVVGESGSGKKNLAEFVVTFSGGIKLTEGSSLAAMRRLVNQLYPALVFDEKNLADPDVQAFLRASHQKGLFSILCHKEDPDKLISLDSYGPRILLGRPTDMEKMREDTTNRIVFVEMLQKTGKFLRAIPRHEAWPVIKKLYLLLLYRWREFLETWKVLDDIISEYIAGHPRDILPIILTPAFLAGEDKFIPLYEGLIEELKQKTRLDWKIDYILKGILRILAYNIQLVPGETFEVSVKDIIEANEGAYESEKHRGLAIALGITLTRGKLPFVVGRRAGRDNNYYRISLESFREYLEAYRPEIPEDLKAEKPLDTLSSLGFNLKEFLAEAPSGETIIKKVCEQISKEHSTDSADSTKGRSKLVSVEKAGSELIRDKVETSSFSEKKPAPSSGGMCGMCGISGEISTQKISSSSTTWREVYDWLERHGGCAGVLAAAVENGLHLDELMQLIKESNGWLILGPTREMVYTKDRYMEVYGG